MIGHKIQRSLHRVEITAAVGADGQLRGIWIRRLRFWLRRECPFLAVDPCKTTDWNAKNRRFYLDIIGPAVLKQIVMRMDRRCVAVYSDRIEMKSVSKAADYGQLIVGRRG